MALRSHIALLFLSFIAFIQTEEVIAKAVTLEDPTPIKKASLSSLLESETGETEESKSAKVKELSKKNSKEDFKANLYHQHSELRKNGGTPRVKRQRTLNGRVLPTPKFSWKADESKPLSKLVIKLEEQKIFGFQDALLVMESDISSGKEAYATKTGSYQILAKSKNHKSNLYGSFVNSKGIIVDANAEVGQSVPEGLRYIPSSMPNYLRLTHQGLGLHAGILPGYPASHGCVRLPTFISEKLFAFVEINTPVEICP